MNPITLWIIVSVLFVLGTVGTLIPALPGIGFVFAGILIYGIVTQFTSVSITTVVALGAFSLLAMALDYVGSTIGAKAAGGGRYALWGTFIGAFIGGVAGPIGIFGGAFIGALIGAIVEGKPHTQALRVALYSVAGTVSASVIQFFFALALIIAFLVAVFV